VIFPFVLALLPRIEILKANDVSFTYRENPAKRVVMDPTTHAWRDVPSKPATHTETRVPHDPAHVAVLFIGNSLTYFNEMPRMTQAIAAGEQRPILASQVTMSGATLEDLWIRTDALRQIWQEHWDYVILQERSGSAAMDRGELFRRCVAMFADEARRSGAQPVLFQTWYAGNSAFFHAAAQRANVRLLAVGDAWDALLGSRRIARLDWDGTHPNLYGSYLIACSVYALVYGRQPHDLPIEFRALAAKNEFYDAPLLDQTINAEQARAIQAAAWRANKP